jgi:hypothetical protein
MRVARTVSMVVALAALVIWSCWALRSPYFRFLGKDQGYYSRLADACDLLIREHPLGTNATVVPIVGTTNEWEVFIRISGRDPSLPKIIRDLNPSQIVVSTNRIYVMVGVREFGLSWEPQNGHTNYWAMYVYGDDQKEVYDRIKW